MPGFPCKPFFALLILAWGSAEASTVVLQQGVIPSGTSSSTVYAGIIDAFVTTGPTGNLSGNNYGGAGAIGVAAAPPSLGGAATNNTKGEFQSILQFDLALVKSTFDAQYGVGHWAVTQVQLQLTATPPNNGIFNGSTTLNNSAGNLDIHWMANDSWTEGAGSPNSPGQPLPGINYTTLQSTYASSLNDQSLGTFSFSGTQTQLNTGAFTYNLGLTSGLLNDATNGSKASFELLASSGSTISSLFASQSNPTAGARPLLSISANAAPEPGRAALLGLSLAAVITRRRRCP